MASSPTQRSLAWCRANGWTTAIVERWNQFAKVRQDLFGIIDVLAMDSDAGCLHGIQTTSGDNVTKRVDKALAEPRIRDWLACGCGFQVHGWRRLKVGNRRLWRLRRVLFRLDCGAVVTEEDS